MAPLISVVVPAYNVETYLDKCINSIVQQTYTNIEIILVDDGSTDNTPALCDQWAKKDARIRVVHQQNKGMSGARNTGIELAMGQYLSFVDSDDYIAPALCQRAVDEFQKNNADIVTFGMARVNSGNECISSHPGKEACLDKEAGLLALYTNEIQNYAWDKVYRRELWKEVRFPEGRAYEDIGTIYKVLLNADVVCCISDVLYSYRKREGSIIANMSAYTLRDLFVMRRQSYDDMMEIYPHIACCRFELVALSAKAYIDRSLWHNPDPQAQNEAVRFLEENRTEGRKINNWELKLYYFSSVLYRFLRLQKHYLGVIIKKLRK